MRNEDGKVVAKQNLPTKVCVVCHRPFTWRKKWENVWNDVTTCSKSCNAERRRQNQRTKKANHQPTAYGIDSDGDDALSLQSHGSVQEKPAYQTHDCEITATNDPRSSSSNDQVDKQVLDTKQAKKLLRKQRKEEAKAQKQARRQKRMGEVSPDIGRKPCDLCHTPVDLLVRCTVDESAQYRMVCGKCWPTVSGGVPDGSPEFPHYNYGGLWKNRNANLPKRIGSGGHSMASNSDTLGQREEVNATLHHQHKSGEDETSSVVS